MSRRRLAAVYGGLSALATVGHIGYPAALWLLTRRRPDPEPPAADPDPWPSVTVLVPAYREAAVIAAKVRDCLDNGYPGELEVLVVADDPDTAAAAADCRATVLPSAERGGKSAAVSAGLAAARGDIVVLTDANARLDPGSIERLARWFGDPGIGAVGGDKRHTHGSEGVYWAFESWLKRRENRLGSSIGLVGECTAVRRSSAPAIPADVVVDDFWLAVAIIRQGNRVVYEPRAVAVEPPAFGAEEWERRTRIVSGAIAMLMGEPGALSPRHPVLAFEVWGHRLLRMTVAPVAHAALLALAVRHSLSRGDGVTVSRAIVAGHAIAAVGVLAPERCPSPVRIAGQVLYLQAVGIGGMVRLVRGDVVAKWPKPEREKSAALDERRSGGRVASG
jgi:biofilm PGA synthesis N-glycosyltransferase PgaC